MLVTIIADASYCHETGAGGYGFWIASGKRKLSGEGQFKDTVDGSLAAELLALANAIHKAKRLKLLRPGDTLVLTSDCQGALQYIREKRTTSVTPDEKKAIDHILQATQFIRVIPRHVKGHSKTRDARSASNRHCDTKAGKHMRAMRERLKAA